MNKMSDSTPNLSLDPGVPNAIDGSNEQIDIDTLTQTLDELNIDINARNRIKIFLNQKEKIGNMNDDDLEKLGVLESKLAGEVTKVRHIPTKLIMARKLIYLELKPTTIRQILLELELLHQCNYPHIVGFYRAYQTDGGISICMEYMDGGSLDLILKRAGRFPESILARITSAVLNGLHYLSERHAISYGDVKPTNILVNSSGEIKICDFGVSHQLRIALTNGCVEEDTRSYASPETLQGIHDPVQSNIWSLGLSLVEMAIGFYPIPAPDAATLEQILADSTSVGGGVVPVVIEPKDMGIFQVLEYIVQETPPKLDHPSFSTEFQDFIDQCLIKNPNERANLKTLLSHPWMEKWKNEDIDIAGWVCRTMNLPPSTPN